MKALQVEPGFFNYRLEQKLLGTLLQQTPSAFSKIATLEAHDFSYATHRLIFQIMTTQWQQQQHVNRQSIQEALESNEAFERPEDIDTYLTQLITEGPFTTSVEDLAQGIHNLAVMRRLVDITNRSYHLQQQQVRAIFPIDDLAEEEEQTTLSEEALEALQVRRRDLKEQAQQFVQLFIDGLRSLDIAQPEARATMLYRLAGMYELSTLIGREVAEAMANKLTIPEMQARASALLKVQAQEVNASRTHITQDLLALDQAWHDPEGRALQEHIAHLLTKPMIHGYYRRGKLPVL